VTTADRACIPLYASSLFVEMQKGVYDFEPVKLVGEIRDRVESQKTELLKLKDVKVGNGSIAAWS
jgi:hypothetical protein